MELFGDPPQIVERAPAPLDLCPDRPVGQPDGGQALGRAVEFAGEQRWPKRAAGICEIAAGMGDALAQRAGQALGDVVELLLLAREQAVEGGKRSATASKRSPARSR